MSRSDTRVRWLRDRALALLGLSDPAPFEELLSRREDADLMWVFFALSTYDKSKEDTTLLLLLLRVERPGPDGEEGVGEGPPAPAR